MLYSSIVIGCPVCYKTYHVFSGKVVSAGNNVPVSKYKIVVGLFAIDITILCTNCDNTIHDNILVEIAIMIYTSLLKTQNNL